MNIYDDPFSRLHARTEWLISGVRQQVMVKLALEVIKMCPAS